MSNGIKQALIAMKFAEIVTAAAENHGFMVGESGDGSFLVQRYADGTHSIIKAVSGELKAPQSVTQPCFWSLLKPNGEMIANGAARHCGEAFHMIEGARIRVIEERILNQTGRHNALLMKQAG